MHLISDQRLRNFNIGISNTSSEVEAPTTSPLNYATCAFHQGVPSQLKTSYHCEGGSLWGRYVTIQIEAPNAILTLCEVEVYSGSISGLNQFRKDRHIYMCKYKLQFICVSIMHMLAVGQLSDIKGQCGFFFLQIDESRVTF